MNLFDLFGSNFKYDCFKIFLLKFDHLIFEIIYSVNIIAALAFK